MNQDRFEEIADYFEKIDILVEFIKNNIIPTSTEITSIPDVKKDLFTNRPTGLNPLDNAKLEVTFVSREDGFEGKLLIKARGIEATKKLWKVQEVLIQNMKLRLKANSVHNENNKG